MKTLTKESGLPINHGKRYPVTLYKMRDTEFVEFKDLPDFQKTAILKADADRQAESRRRKDEDTRIMSLYFVGKVKPTKLKPAQYYVQWLEENNLDNAYLDVLKHHISETGW